MRAAIRPSRCCESRSSERAHTPLLGAWSPWGWAHPGPVLFYALAPFYRVFGETGVLVGMGLLNAAAIAGVIVVAHRRGGVELAALAGLMMALLVHSLGVSLLVDIWNPFAAFLPFVLFVMLAWGVLCRDWMLLPVAILVGSSVVQIHAGYIPSSSRSSCSPRVLPSSSSSTTHAAHRHGKPAAPWTGADGLGCGGARHLVARARTATVRRRPESAPLLCTSVIRPSRPRAGRPVRCLRPRVPAGHRLGRRPRHRTGVDRGRARLARRTHVAVVVAAGLLAWRRRHRDVAWLCVVVVITVASALLATARLTGPLFVYVTRWWWAAAAIANLAIVWAVIRLAGNRTLDRVVTAAALVAIVVVGLMSVADLPVSFAHPEMTPAIGALERPTESALDHHDRYLIDRLDSSQLGLSAWGCFARSRPTGSTGCHRPTRSPTSCTAAGALPRLTRSTGSSRSSTWPNPDGRCRPRAGWPRPTIRSRLPIVPVSSMDTRIRAEMGANAPAQGLGPTPYDKVFAESSGASTVEVDELAALQQHGRIRRVPVARALRRTPSVT